MLKISPLIIDVLKTLNNASKEAYVVGGFIRDNLLGKESFDVDICTNADAVTMMTLFASHNPKQSHHSFGAVSFTVAPYHFELTQYRTEKGAISARYPLDINATQSLKEDLMRRDFTINTLCYHHEEGLIDLLGGLNDLKSLRLKTVVDPYESFKHDYLRIVRLYRFKSQLNFEIETLTLKAAQELEFNLATYPTVWWEQEFFKTLMGDAFLTLSLDNPQFLITLVPLLKDAYDFDQNNPYHKFSLYEHTMRVVGLCPKNLNLRLAALFHDLGKSTCREDDDLGVSHFRGHALASYTLAKEYIHKFSLSEKDKAWILNLIQYHDLKLKEDEKSLYSNAVQFGMPFMHDLIKLKRADNLAKSDKALYQVDRCDAFTVILNEISMKKLPLKVSDLLVDGHDCMALGIMGPQISKVLEETFKVVVEKNLGNDYKQQMKVLEGVIHNDTH